MCLIGLLVFTDAAGSFEAAMPLVLDANIEKAHTVAVSLHILRA
jgi:hypothetical protein